MDEAGDAYRRQRSSSDRAARTQQCATMFTEELPWPSGRDLELVMGRAVCDWTGWKLLFD